MDSLKTNSIDEARASALLGISIEDVRRLSADASIGQDVFESGVAHRVFTYEELYRMCRFAARVSA